MNIKIVSFSASGGAGVVSKNLAKGFRDNGVQVELITKTGSNLWKNPLALPKTTLLAGLDHFLLRKSNWGSMVSLLRDRTGNSSSMFSEVDAVILRWSNGMLSEDDYERLRDTPVLIALDDENPFTGACHHSLSCSNFVHGCAGCPAVRVGQSAVQKNLEKKLQRYSALKKVVFIAPTMWIKERFDASWLARQLGVTAVSIPNPIDPAYMNSMHRRRQDFEKKLLLIANRVDDPGKGIITAKATLQSLASKGWSITIVGEASSRIRELFQFATFTGSLTQEKIISQMRINSVLLVPSLFENAGTVVAEAASQGMVVFARNVGGMPEMVDAAGFGRLFDQNVEIVPLLEALSPEIWSEMGRAGQSWAKQFDTKQISKILLTHIEDLKQ